MMPVGQVFYGQAYLRQGCVGALKLNPLGIAEALQINERFGGLLFEERKAAGYSLDRVAQAFGLTVPDLYDWELGLASPPAKVFYAIVKFYGPAAFHRAAELDMEIQLEKYDILTVGKNSPVPVHNPSSSQSYSLAA